MVQGNPQILQVCTMFFGGLLIVFSVLRIRVNHFNCYFLAANASGTRQAEPSTSEINPGTPGWISSVNKWTSWRCWRVRALDIFCLFFLFLFIDLFGKSVCFIWQKSIENIGPIKMRVFYQKKKKDVCECVSLCFLPTFWWIDDIVVKFSSF